MRPVKHCYECANFVPRLPTPGGEIYGTCKAMPPSTGPAQSLFLNLNKCPSIIAITPVPMEWISTTIKKKWMDQILSGETDTELIGANNFWDKRLGKLITKDDGLVAINFLCCQKAYAFKVKEILYVSTLCPKKIDEKYYKTYWKIRLGARIR